MQPKSVRRVPLNVALAILAVVLAPSLANAQSESVEIGVVGPLERVDCKRGTVEVLGITAQIRSDLALRALCAASREGLLVLVATSGTLKHSSKPPNAEDALLLDGQYVPGATIVFVRGPVTSISNYGEFSIAGARVQSPFGEMPQLGEIIDVVGTQPLPGGVLLAQEMSRSAGMGRYEAIIQAVTESGGSSQSIIGSGKSAQSIIGSGAASQSIIGSGRSTQSIEGSRAFTSSIIGSGASTQSIIGSGRSSQSIIGSGASTSSIIGSGRSTQSIIGSGASMSSIIGSGVTL